MVSQLGMCALSQPSASGRSASLEDRTTGPSSAPERGDFGGLRTVSVLGPVTPASQSSSFPGDISRGTGQDTRPILVHPGSPATLVLGGLSPGRGFSSQVLALPAAPSLGLGSGAVSGYGLRIQEGSQSGPWSTEEVGRASARRQVSAPRPRRLCSPGSPPHV